MEETREVMEVAQLDVDNKVEAQVDETREVIKPAQLYWHMNSRDKTK